MHPRTVWLLAKRLYKKVTFLLILALIPLLIIALTAAAKQESGFLTVALAAEKENDPTAAAVLAELTQPGSLVLFHRCTTVQEAVDMVKYGKADSAWIFPADMQDKISGFLNSEEKYIVRVVEREENVALKLLREKLSAALFSHCAKPVYLSYVRENIDQLDHLSDEALLDFYDGYNLSGTLFSFQTPDSVGGAPTADNYLTFPVRGLLSVLTVLCGLATTLYYCKDRSGILRVIPVDKRPAYELICQLISVGSVAAAALIALMLSGLSANLIREILVLPLYILAAALFCILIRQLLKSIRIIATLTPLLSVVMLAVCPIFFRLKSTRLLQLLFPTTHYLNAVAGDRGLLQLALYIAALGALTAGRYWYEIRRCK